MQKLIAKNYKEPLSKIPKGKGYGYYGVVMTTENGDAIQCHVCGELFVNLNSHLIKHKMSVNEYKRKYKLAGSNNLLCEQEKMRLRNKTLTMLKNMSEEEKMLWEEKRKKALKNYKHKAHGKKITLETKNKRGICQDQLLDKISQCKNEIKKTPSKKDFNQWADTQKYTHRIYQEFGSWKNALTLLGLQPNKPQSNGKKPRYTREDLLERLRIFAQDFNKIPTETDFKSGLLPDSDVYRRRWKTIDNARQEAGVYDIVDEDIVEQFVGKNRNGNYAILSTHSVNNY
jgi:hypothetical protein